MSGFAFDAGPARSPYRVGHDWTGDEFGISTRDPAKRETMRRQAIRELTACATADSLEAAWARHSLVCAALRDGGDHARADDILDTYARRASGLAEADAMEAEFGEAQQRDA